MNERIKILAYLINKLWTCPHELHMFPDQKSILTKVITPNDPNIRQIPANSPFVVLDVISTDFFAQNLAIISVLHGERQGFILYPQSAVSLAKLKRLK